MSYFYKTDFTVNSTPIKFKTLIVRYLKGDTTANTAHGFFDSEITKNFKSFSHFY